MSLIEPNICRGVEYANFWMRMGYIACGFRPRGGKSVLYCLSVTNIDQHELYIFRSPRSKIAPRRWSNIYDADTFGVFPAAEKLNDNPSSKETCLIIRTLIIWSSLQDMSTQLHLSLYSAGSAQEGSDAG